MRSIQHFSLLYEKASHPVLRVSWNEVDDSTIAFTHKDDENVYLLDIRYFLYEQTISRNPSSPLPLHSHSSAVNAFAWSPVSSQYLVSVGEDAHVSDGVAFDVIVFYMGF